MKLVKSTKTFKFEGFEFTLRNLTARDSLEIQKAAVTLPKMSASVTKENVAEHASVDSAMFRLLKVVRSIVAWNVEAEESTDEKMVHLPVNEENVSALPQNVFEAIEKEINEEKKEAEIKN